MQCAIFMVQEKNQVREEQIEVKNSRHPIATLKGRL